MLRMVIGSGRIRRIAVAYLVSLGVWLGFALLLTSQYRVIDLVRNIPATLGDAFILAAVRCLALAILTPPIFYIVSRFPVHGKSAIARLVGYLLGSPLFVVSYACLRWTIYPTWNAAQWIFVPRSSHSLMVLMREGFADQVTMYVAIVVAAHAYEYFERARTQELQRRELEQALAASELQALKSQLHPHFLFNTLHGIATLIDGDGKNAKAMIVKVSELLRIALEHGASDLIPLKKELQFAGAYLELEKMRLGSRLTVRWLIDSDTAEMLVPQLILQPLVENAILHGVACCREGGWVEITARANPADSRLTLEVRNSVGGKRPAGTGLGIKNTSARLRYLYSDEASFSFSISAERTAMARIVLPALHGHRKYPPAEGPKISEFKLEGDQHARTYRG
jgi:two-component system, LytTR family, sensor kinase